MHEVHELQMTVCVSLKETCILIFVAWYNETKSLIEIISDLGLYICLPVHGVV